MNNSTLEALYRQKAMKLSQQKSLSDEFHGIVQKLAFSNSLERTNLLAAIAVSKRPGYFEYYEPSDEIKHLEGSNVLRKLAAKISAINHELEQINEEINLQRQSTTQISSLAHPLEVTKVSHWFDLYGRPTRLDDDRMTTFVPNKKIYGGTNQYKSFKSVASTMKKGRITN